MKNLMIAVVAFLGLNLFSAEGDYFAAVAKNSILQELSARGYLQSINSITKTATYRCPGCYAFSVVAEIANGETEEFIFETSYDFQKDVIKVMRK